MKILAFFLLFAFAKAQNEDAIPSTMCPRFSINEFQASVLTPLFKNRIDFARDFLKTASEAVEEMLLKVEEKKGNDGEDIKSRMKNIKEKGVQTIQDVCEKHQNDWKFEHKSSTQQREFFQEQIELMDKVEHDLSQAFKEMVEISKNLMNPVVGVMVKMLEEKSGTEREEQKVNKNFTKPSSGFFLQCRG